MIKKSVLAFGLILFFNAMALAQSNNLRSTEAQIFELDLPASYYIDEVVDLVNRIQLIDDTSYKIGQTAVADACVAFMNKDEFLGPLGQSINKRIMSNGNDYPYLLAGGDVQKACPKYVQMSQKKKSLVWVLVLTMVAHFESSCRLNASAKGPNGTAQGLYQLHKGKESSYTDSKKACPTNASLDANKSSGCILAMLDDQLEKMNGKLFAPKSYWDVLRPQARSKRAAQIAATLKQSSLCSVSSM